MSEQELKDKLVREFIGEFINEFSQKPNFESSDNDAYRMWRRARRKLAELEAENERLKAEILRHITPENTQG